MVRRRIELKRLVGLRSKSKLIAAGAVITAVLVAGVSLAYAAPGQPSLKFTKASASAVVVTGKGFTPNAKVALAIAMGGCSGEGVTATNESGAFRARLEVTDQCTGKARVTAKVGGTSLSGAVTFGTGTVTTKSSDTTSTIIATLPKQNTGAPDIDFQVDELAGGFDHPWDTGIMPDGNILVPERPGRLKLVSKTGDVKEVRADLGDVYAKNESGLLGLALYPDFGQSRMFVTCMTYQENGQDVDNRLIVWKLSADGSTAQRTAKPLLTGIPLGDNARHSGCRPTFGADGDLYVGTGDAQEGEMPQDLSSLGGKVLRINSKTGAAVPGNPFFDSADAKQKLIWTYGQRNVQGVAQEPGSDRMWSSEHGPTFDDEITGLKAGGNGGWNPTKGGDYDESVPMTDVNLDNVIPAAWQAGEPTQEPSGIAFLGPKWGADAKVLAVSMQRAQKLVLMRVEGAKVVAESSPAALDGKFGRIRSVRTGPDGSLYVTTDNGGDDKILKLTRAGGVSANR